MAIRRLCVVLALVAGTGAKSSVKRADGTCEWLCPGRDHAVKIAEAVFTAKNESQQKGLFLPPWKGSFVR